MAAKAATKTVVYQALSEKTELTKKDIGKVFDQVKGRPLYVIDQAIVDGELQ